MKFLPVNCMLHYEMAEDTGCRIFAMALMIMLGRGPICHRNARNEPAD